MSQIASQTYRDRDNQLAHHNFRLCSQATKPVMSATISLATRTVASSLLSFFVVYLHLSVGYIGASDITSSPNTAVNTGKVPDQERGKICLLHTLYLRYASKHTKRQPEVHPAHDPACPCSI
eukprot:scaffold258526_cov22-Prasinocladus_malaysianus.AAC.1